MAPMKAAAAGGGSMGMKQMLCSQLFVSVCSIRSTLETHLEQKDSPPLLGLDALSEEITLGQGADVWRAAVEFRRK